MQLLRKRPKKRLIVHIGHPKTGTSTIQKTLAENEASLRKLGIVYPNFGQKFNAHHLLVSALVSHKNDNFLPKSNIEGEEIIATLRKLSADLDIETIVLSSEAFVSAIGFKSSFEQLADMFSLHVIWVVRAPTEYATSMANQRIRMGFFQDGITLDRVIKESIGLVDYAEKAILWTGKFPRAKFSVASMTNGFDAWSFFSTEVNPDLCSLNGLTEMRNVSVAPEALAFLLRIQNQVRKRSNLESSRIMSMLEEYTKTASLYPRNVTVIPPDAQVALMRKFKDTGSEMARMFPGFDPAGLEPRKREFVDLAAIPPEHIMHVYDFCMELYNKHVDYLRR